ncbi:MAG: transposase [Prevotellaceae bacterium]|nr:transposase [Prevotellaceae bacterium]
MSADCISSVNEEGFIKYSAIYEGNTADCNTPGDMMDKLRVNTGEQGKKAIVVIDAGISTEANLKMITEKGCDYVCVSRSNLKKYSVVEDALPVKVIDNRKREIELIHVQTENSKDKEYYLRVTSPTEALRESSMYSQFMERFEEGLALYT